MARIGYITDRACIPESMLAETKEVMESLHCDKVYEESVKESTQRPYLKYIMEETEDRDTIVLHKLSNALANTVELINLCRLCAGKSIRLVSVHDRIDTSMELYNTTAMDWVVCLSTFCLETYLSKHRTVKLAALPDSIKTIEHRRLQDQKEVQIVDMYMSEFSYDDIMKRLNIGSARTIARALKKHGVELCRKKYDRVGLQRARKDTEDE